MREPVLTRTFVLVSVAHFLQGLSIFSFVHLPGYLHRLGAAETLIGFLYGLLAFAALAARPAIGRAMDGRGRRIVILLGSILEVAVCLAYLTVTSIGPWLAVVRIAHGVAEAALFSSLFTYAADIIPASRRTEGIALFGISGLLPMSVAGALGDFILERWDYPQLFLTAAGFSFVGFLLVLPLREPVRPDEGPARTFLASALQRDLLPLWFIGGCFATVLAAIFTFLKTYVIETHLGSVGTFFSMYSGAAVLLRLTFSWLPERVGPKRVLFPAIGTLAAGLALLALARSPAMVLAAGVLCGLGHGYVFPILTGLVVSRARGAERGAAISLFTAVFDLGTLIGGPLFGATVESLGYPSMYAIAAGVAVTGAIAFAIWDRRR
jgi:MFS family permease